MNISSLVDLKFKELANKSEISFKIQINDMPLSSYLYIKKDSNKLFVVLNGALEKNRKTNLTYQRYSWHPLFDGSVLYIADPTLFKYTSLSLAWYMGDKYTPLHGYLAEFALAVAKNLDIDIHHLVFYGSSGGGFTALQLASYVANGSVAVSINPQTNIMKYVDTNRDPFLAQCFSVSLNDHEELSRNHRFNAIENIKINNTKVLFIQNKTDVFHVTNHFEPLIADLNIKDWTKTFTVDKNNASRVQVLWYEHESGHGAEPKDFVPQIMSAVDYMINEVK